MAELGLDWVPLLFVQCPSHCIQSLVLGPGKWRNYLQESPNQKGRWFESSVLRPVKREKFRFIAHLSFTRAGMSLSNAEWTFSSVCKVTHICWKVGIIISTQHLSPASVFSPSGRQTDCHQLCPWDTREIQIKYKESPWNWGKGRVSGTLSLEAERSQYIMSRWKSDKR